MTAPQAREALTDERAKFEKWALSEAGGWWPDALTRAGEDYKAGAVTKQWVGWQARAALDERPRAEPVAWLESPHGQIRANPLWKLREAPQTLQWSIPLYPPSSPVQQPSEPQPKQSDEARDAARYQWLRATFNGEIGDGAAANHAWNILELGYLNANKPADLDAAIDAAMEAK